MTKLTAEYLIDDLTPAERQRAERVEAILPTLKARAEAEQEAIDQIRRVLTINQHAIVAYH